MTFEDGSPYMIVLWLWLLLAPVAGVLVDRARMRRDVRHHRPVVRDDDRHDGAYDRGLNPMARPVGGAAR